MLIFLYGSVKVFLIKQSSGCIDDLLCWSVG